MVLVQELFVYRGETSKPVQVSYFTIWTVNYLKQMLYLIMLIYFFNRDLVAGEVDVPSAVGVEAVITASAYFNGDKET